MAREVLALLGAGCALALCEVAYVLLRGRALFLSSLELAQYAVGALCAFAVLVALLGVPLRVCTRADRVGYRARVAAAICSLGLGLWAGWSLTAGRRVRDLSARPVLVAVFAVLLALAVILGLRTATWVRERRARGAATVWAAGCLSAGVLALVLDASILPRSYPAFHWGLFGFALLATALSAVALPEELLPRAPRLARVLAGGVFLAAPLSMFALARHTNASYAAGESAPFTGKLLTPILSRLSRKSTRQAPVTPAVATSDSSARGIDLQDKDVLLITVDALRADMLAAYGGNGVTPALDELARESMVFRRAYTPAPHTSYALASLLTAKFMKPVLELPGAERDPPTLPDLLRRYGYRTAAFYPPAIFFVDGSHFDTLRNRGFGFEYRKEMFASAKQRVTQLDAYLKEVEPGHPLFVWVHLFEPHEPYEPEPEFLKGDSPRARYEGEVRACDQSIRELVQLFRAARPLATVVVTADHGEEFGEHGGSYHGTTLYDEQVRVPLVWSSPGSVAPGVSDVPVELVDIGTTLLSAAGVPREARMRGDDLGAVLAGNAHTGPELAFASVERRHMVSDGRIKAVCAADELHCQLFDLQADPAELRNLASERAADVERLRGAVDRFFAAIPRTEALAMAAGVGFPEVLARAKLGAPGVGPELVPLLADSRAPVRAAAARALGELKQASAVATLERMRESDPDSNVRAEAAIAALILGSEAAEDAVVAVVATGSSQARDAQDKAGTNSQEERGLIRRAALALARSARPEALPALSELALDSSAAEEDRLLAVRALGESRQVQALDALIPLLADVRLRETAAGALGQLGGARARTALAAQLADERYEPARRAEAQALKQLGDKRVVPLTLHFLGMESSMPDGVRLLIEFGVLGRGSRHGLRMAESSGRRGEWTCDQDACTPGQAAELLMPSATQRAGTVRATWLVRADNAGTMLQIDQESFSLHAGEQQISVVREGRAAMRYKLATQGGASVIAVVIAPAVAEIPPPPAEPWDAGVGEVVD